jgi:hypothetical protein
MTGRPAGRGKSRPVVRQAGRGEKGSFLGDFSDLFLKSGPVQTPTAPAARGGSVASRWALICGAHPMRRTMPDYRFGRCGDRAVLGSVAAAFLRTLPVMLARQATSL